MRKKARTSIVATALSAVVAIVAMYERLPVEVFAMEESGTADMVWEEPEKESLEGDDSRSEETKTNGSDAAKEEEGALDGLKAVDVPENANGGEQEVDGQGIVTGSEEDRSIISSDQDQTESAGQSQDSIENETIPDIRETVQDADSAESDSVTITVPIYNYDIVNVVVPASYAVALNPYGYAVNIGDGTVSTEQVVSRNYGIVNKSSSDKLVKVTLTVEDLNDGRIVFVESPEEALNAEEDMYAIYLAMIPSAEGGVGLNDVTVDEGTLSEELANISMTRADEVAVPLKAGENQISFRLSKAVYEFGNGEGITLGDASGMNPVELFKLTGLSADGRGITAFTFSGAMNPKADWAKLLGGLKISVVYTYENAAGDESIVKGTGAMIAP